MKKIIREYGFAIAIWSLIPSLALIGILARVHAQGVGINAETGRLYSLLVSSNLTPVTVNANTAATQNLMSYAIPAGSMNAVGKTIRITGHGTFNTTNVIENAELSFVLNTNSLAILDVVSSGAAAGSAWGTQIVCTTTTAGSSGVILCGVIGTTSPSGVTYTNIAGGNSSAILATNLTVSQTLQFTIGFTSASTSNSGTQNALLVENLN
ncbi:MAG TPA: hypothetical protein VG345_16600 [Bryobacteraceae bacterium]|jgi:hypothetical protein|nr:hypothetical protein [Bryobacteraceae bacterium]